MKKHLPSELAYFMISVMFNKKIPRDFGLVCSDHENIFLLPTDQSQWIERKLYDFGWGQEYGFCRLPMLCFQELITLVKQSKIRDNRYGAATILLEDYPLQLLDYCQDVLKSSEKASDHAEFFQILELDMFWYRPNLTTLTQEEFSAFCLAWEQNTQEVKKYTKQFEKKAKKQFGARYLPGT